MVLASALAPHWTVVVGAILLGVYLVFALICDRCVASRPSRDLLVQTLNGLRDCGGRPLPNAELAVPYEATTMAVNAAIESTLRRLQSRRQQHREMPIVPGEAHYALFIETATVLSSWREAHRLDQLCWQVASPEAVVEHLLTAKVKLSDIKSPPTDVAEAKALVARITECLNADDPNPTARPLLDEALTLLYSNRDMTYDSLADRQTKASWFAILGVILITIAALTFHRESLFLAGAVGALLSRVSRLLHRQPGAWDYGVSSAAFLLAPVVGALSGWFGVAIVNGLVTAKVLSGDTFGKVWDQPASTWALAIAFAFGFIERLIDRFATTTAKTIGPANPSTSASPTTTGNPE